MEKVHNIVSWYQQKIGSYDKQLWEQSVEQKVLKGIKQAPRRSVRPKTELIDVDLVRGSTFTKTKPQVPWTYITLKTFSRVVFFPFHYKWWIQQTSIPFWMLLMLMYMMQIFTIIVFSNSETEEITRDEQSLSEVVLPCVLMVLLGMIHSQTILTHLKPPIRDNKRDGWRRKRSLSQNRTSVTSSDLLCNSTTPGSDLPTSSQSRSSLKGHVGSRPLRERTKERKVRLKSNSQRPSLWRENRENLNDHGSQDSESAYHTHEASDSIADKTSSMEQDSNGRNIRTSNSIDSKLDISPKVSVPVKQYKNCKDDESKNVSQISYRKPQESQESDLPEDSNSEDEALLKSDKNVKEKSKKRHSQSISSENDEDDSEKITAFSNKTSETTDVDKASVEVNNGVTNIQNGHLSKGEGTSCKDELEKKLSFEAKSHKGCRENENVNVKETNENQPDLNSGSEKPQTTQEVNKTVNEVSKVIEVNMSDSSFVDVSVESISTHTLIAGADTQNTSSDEKLAHISNFSSQNGDLKPTLFDNGNSDLVLKCSSHTGNTVHFTKDLVNLREITPKSSRETTPIHTQSDVLLQSKHQSDALLQNKHIRESNLNNKTDTESELSDHDLKSCKILPNVRRRKVTVQDCTEGNGTTVRNRRTGLTLRDKKNNSTAVSSSDGETEGQSSEYSREGRRNMASSEEWGDHLQSDVDSTSETSSCASEPEISEHEEPAQESDNETQCNLGPNQGMTASNIHVINLLQPSSCTSGQSSSHVPDKVTCIIWERNECKKVELTALDIGWAIIETVDKIQESSDYIWIGLTFSIVMGFTPLFFQAFHAKELPSVLSWDSLVVILELLFWKTWRENLIHSNAVLQRLCLSAIFFFMLSVADRTFKQRLLYAKHFCYLTSSRRARKFDMPHFRLNKVRNIRTWLSLRSYLKKRGPQRSVDVIVSSAFMLTLIMLIMMCLQLLRDAEIYLNYLCNWEILVWCMALGVYLLRFMTLGLRINKKYRNLSVLITEQINLYLQMEQKPHKKEELMVANNVLKLAESLLKELESPFKISGISANPFILNVTRVVVLSAFSAVVSEVLGFKLKLYKIKLRA